MTSEERDELRRQMEQGTAANPTTVLALLDEIDRLRVLIEDRPAQHPEDDCICASMFDRDATCQAHPAELGRICDGCGVAKDRVCIECEMCPDCGCEGCPTE